MDLIHIFFNFFKIFPNYGASLSLQPYMSPNSILTVSEQEEIFSYQCHMNDLKYNFPGIKFQEKCICENILTNKHLFYCEKQRKNYQYTISGLEPKCPALLLLSSSPKNSQNLRNPLWRALASKPLNRWSSVTPFYKWEVMSSHHILSDLVSDFGKGPTPLPPGNSNLR